MRPEMFPYIFVIILCFTQGLNKPTEEVCNTSSCAESAKLLLNYMDQSVDPCDNFYDFVCGGFLNETDIPDDKTEVGAISDLTDLVQTQLRMVLEESSSNESKPLTAVKQFYKMCLDTESLEDMAPVRKLLKDLGGWPVLEGKNWNERYFTWDNSAYNFETNGFSPDNFITVKIGPDKQNSSQMIIYIDQATLEIARENLLDGLDDIVVKPYVDYMVDLAVMFGAKRGFAEKEVKDMVNFKIQLANISASSQDRLDEEANYNPMNLLELQSMYPGINWKEYLGQVFLHQIHLADDQKISVNSPGYISQVVNVLSKSPKRAQANHAIFQALRSIEWALPKIVRDREQEFQGIVFGLTKRAPRWKECVTQASDGFSIAVQSLYVRKFANQESKQTASEMIMDIKDAFIQVLNQAEWMDEATRKEATEKALAMISFVAFPDEFLDDKKVDMYYSDLDIRFDNIFTIWADLSRFTYKTVFPMLHKPINRMDWRTQVSVIEVNAAYSTQDNTLHLPISVLQGIVFDKNRLQAMNYGVMGFFIGHEVTHAFDNQGRKFDKDGNLMSWWTPEVGEAFEKKADCIVEQYSNYTVPEIGVNLNGVLSQGENIADNGGVKEAYIAYNSWVKRHGPEPKLPGLKYDAKQLFWISAASVWCNKEKASSLHASVLDQHAIPRFRVIGSFSNSDLFAKDFNCPEDSNMNPKEKCSVW